MRAVGFTIQHKQKKDLLYFAKKHKPTATFS